MKDVSHHCSHITSCLHSLLTCHVMFAPCSLHVHFMYPSPVSCHAPSSFIFCHASSFSCIMSCDRHSFSSSCHMIIPSLFHVMHPSLIRSMYPSLLHAMFFYLLHS
jgi:hypothetical protein